MPLGRAISKGLVYTIDLSKIADRANPRTVEAPIFGGIQEPTIIDWGDGTSDTVTTGSFPTHTYDTAEIYTVVMRSATGHFPRIAYNTGQASSDDPTSNISYAVKSIDHFAGEISGSNTGTSQYIARRCYNLEYIAPRLLSSEKWSSFYYALAYSIIQQPLESFCFDFNTNVTDFQSLFRGTRVYGNMPRGLFKDKLAANFSACFQDCIDITGVIPSDTFSGDANITNLYSTFRGCLGITGIGEGVLDSCISLTSISGMFLGCKGLTAIPPGLFDNNTAITNVNGAFTNCSNIGGEPYKFWEQSYALNITNTRDCYTGCSDALRAQVPEAYGGTMTVS